MFKLEFLTCFELFIANNTRLYVVVLLKIQKLRVEQWSTRRVFFIEGFPKIVAFQILYRTANTAGMKINR